MILSCRKQETNTKQCNLTQACSRRSSAEETREDSFSFYGILSVNDEHWWNNNERRNIWRETCGSATSSKSPHMEWDRTHASMNRSRFSTTFLSRPRQMSGGTVSVLSTTDFLCIFSKSLFIIILEFDSIQHKLLRTLLNT